MTEKKKACDWCLLENQKKWGNWSFETPSECGSRNYCPISDCENKEMSYRTFIKKWR